MSKSVKTGAALKAGDDAERREAARKLGAARSPRKSAASSRNLILARSMRPYKLLATIPCNCGGEDLDHKSTCPRGRTIRRRRKLGQPLE